MAPACFVVYLVCYLPETICVRGWVQDRWIFEERAQNLELVGI